MPRNTAARGRGKRTLGQNTLDTFLSSSPPRPERSDASRTRAKHHPRPSEEESQSSDAGAIHFEAQNVTTDEDEARSSPRRPAAKKRKLRKTRADSGEEARSRQPSEDAPGVPVSWKSCSKAAGKRRAVVLDDSSEDEVQHRKRKLVKGHRPPSPEEHEDLLGEIDEHRIIEPRLRSRNKRSAFQEKLDKLRRKKRGERVALFASSESGGDTEDDTPFTGARPDGAQSKSDGSGDTAEDDDDPFIVEDDGAVVPDLPAEFSMNTYQDLIHQFKIICQLFVHLAVHKVDEREQVIIALMNNQYFSVPLQITRRKLVGMRDSLVTSSIWRTEFRKSLETYPSFETIRLDYAEPGCDACHLSSRMSTLIGRLSGQPYDPSTLEPLEEKDSSDHSEDDDNDEGLRSHVKKEFHLGRFCAARTRVFHKFSHWEYTLFQALAQEIDELRTGAGARGFVRVAYARGIEPPEDLTDADGIMDWLDQRGIINIEWQRMKDMMESARNLEMRAKRGEDDID